LAPGSIL